LNFSKFQKVSEDDKTVTMRHEKGHEMRILLKQLRPIEREQIRRLKMAKGGDPADAIDSGSGDLAQAAPTSGLAPVASAPIAPPPPAAPMAPPPPAQSAQSVAPVPIDAPQTPAAPAVLNPEGTMDPGAAAQAAQKAIEMQSDIDAQAAQAKARYDQQYLEERQRLAKQDVDNLQELKSHTDDFAQYIKSNPINPNLYGESQDGLQKTATGIGLFLGGLGGQGHNNMALDFLNKNIERNIAAQRENAANRKTIWGAYHDLYGSEQVANNLAKISANDILTHQVELTAARLGTAQAKQRAMQLKAAKAIENSKLLQDSAVDIKALPGARGMTLGAVPSPTGGAMASNAPTSGEKGTSGLLIPNSEQRFKQLAYTPKARENLAAIQHQYNNAVQADKALSQIDETFGKLENNADAGSIGGNLRRRGSHAVAGIPFGVGQALSSSLNYLTDTEANKAYDSNQSNLIGFVSSALKGTNIGGQQIEDIVQKNSPERGDSPELIHQKKNNIIDFIKNHTDTSLLKAWGLTQ